MKNTKISIIFGGKSPEHPASLESFRHVLSTLESEQHDLIISSIIYLDRDNIASIHRYKKGISSEEYIQHQNPMSFIEAVPLLSHEQAYIINLLHGSYGEDGHIQGIAKYAGLKGTFGNVLPSSLAMSKYHMSKYVEGNHKTLKLPKTRLIFDKQIEQAHKTIINSFRNQKIVIKPNSLGASLFTELYTLRTTLQDSIYKNLQKIFLYDQLALAQEYIEGVEYSIGCIRHFGKTIILPPVFIETDRQFSDTQRNMKLARLAKLL
ncbi:MAG: D-alanine--D-alanine ligase [Gammaproteobacteria bacterium]|nr:D-alanine--D-alanine ligase [Gammaproteobacteria bacterium]